MDRSKLIWIGVTIGGLIGGYIPVLWGGSAFSIGSILWSGVGSMIGIYLGFKFGE